MPVTVIHSTASAQSRVATLHLIVHELLALLGGRSFFELQQSLVRMKFEMKLSSRMKRLGEVQIQWSSLQQTLEGNTHWVAL